VTAKIAEGDVTCSVGGVDLNDRPLGYECNKGWNFNNLQGTDGTLDPRKERKVTSNVPQVFLFFDSVYRYDSRFERQFFLDSPGPCNQAGSPSPRSPGGEGAQDQLGNGS
jgi:hypothetical protein